MCSSDLIDKSHIMSYDLEGDSKTLLTDVKDDLEHLKECYIELMEVSELENHQEIANYAQDRILALSKHIWMLKSTLD